MQALLRRIALDSRALGVGMGAGDELADAPAIKRGPLRIDAAARTAALDGVALELTPKEFDLPLLLLFAAHPGRAFSRTFLLRRVWDGDYEGMERTVDTHVTRLRKKLGGFGKHIVTVWAVGYRFEG